jgi:hypothetical protein
LLGQEEGATAGRRWVWPCGLVDVTRAVDLLALPRPPAFICRGAARRCGALVGPARSVGEARVGVCEMHARRRAGGGGGSRAAAASVCLSGGWAPPPSSFLLVRSVLILPPYQPT